MATTARKTPAETTQLVEIEKTGIEAHGFVTPTSFKKLWEGKGWKLTDAKAAATALESVPKDLTPIPTDDKKER